MKCRNKIYFQLLMFESKQLKKIQINLARIPKRLFRSIPKNLKSPESYNIVYTKSETLLEFNLTYFFNQKNIIVLKFFILI